MSAKALGLDVDVAAMLDEGGALMTAAVSYVVAEKSDDNAWATLSSWAARMKQDNMTHAAMKELFRLCEQKVKEEYGLTSMPSKWRSSKANILNAWEMGIDFDQPKSKVDVALKSAKSEMSTAELVISVAEYVKRKLEGKTLDKEGLGLYDAAINVLE